MKRIISLALSLSICAACLMPAKAEAVNISANGVFTARGHYFANDNFKDSSLSYDPYNIGSNLMLGLNLAVSPNLYGVFLLRNLDATWGAANGTEVRSNGWQGDGTLGMFLGYVQYNSDFAKLTVGQVNTEKGSYTFGNALNNTLPMAGVQVGFELNSNANLDLAFYRPSTTLGIGSTGTASNFIVAEGGAINLVEASLPLNFDEFKIRPYASYMQIGENNKIAMGSPMLDIASGIFGSSYYADATGTKALTGKTDAYVAGFSAMLNPMDYLTLSFDAQYGASKTYNDLDYANRAGFIIGANATYNLTFANLGLIAWYGSGDDDDATNGSERAVVFATTAPNMVAKLAGPFAGDLLFDFDTTIMDPSSTGVTQLPGTMGATVAISNMTFADKLYHSVWANYTAGTSNSAASNATPGLYTVMTTEDSVVQFGLANWYIVNPNLNFAFEVAYGMSNFVGATAADNPLMVDIRMNYMF